MRDPIIGDLWKVKTKHMPWCKDVRHQPYHIMEPGSVFMILEIDGPEEPNYIKLLHNGEVCFVTFKNMSRFEFVCHG